LNDLIAGLPSRRLFNFTLKNTMQNDLHIILFCAAGSLILFTVAILIASRERHNRRLNQMAQQAAWKHQCKQVS